jgi:hypothetical protein
VAVRRLAAAIGLVLLVAGCGGGGNDRAKSVSQYIDQVNSIQHGLALPLGDVALGYTQLSKGEKLETVQPKLEKSAVTIRKLERRVDALQVPPVASRLDSLIRRLVHGEVQLADEVALLAAYARDSQPILLRAATAGKTLQTSLHGAHTRVKQADALEAYAAPLDGVAKDLEALHAPLVIQPSQRIQVQTYRDVARRARALATALRAKKNGAQQLHALEVAVASSSSIPAQKARIAAVKGFNRRVARLRALEVQAQHERSRLERTL